MKLLTPYLLKKPLLNSLVILLTFSLACSAKADLHITIVQGLSGAPEYKDKFEYQFSSISTASNALANTANVHALKGDTATRSELLAHFSTLSSSMTEDDRAVIYLIGHGSFDGEQYKFNIPGPDITTNDLLHILESLPGQNHFLLDTSSASGALLETLESDNRILVTATRNGNEKNATEFGEFFAAALSSEEADLNKNNTISIQEAFDYAERNVADHFESAGRLATEHPQIRGEGTENFSIARIVSNASPINSNPQISQLLEQRQAIDSKIEELQLRRIEYSNADYISQLQALILESANINEQITLLSEEGSGNGANQ